MLAEDALFAHAGAEDLNTCQQDVHPAESHSEDDPAQSSHRDISHFGHCSFLMIEPVQSTTFAHLPNIYLTPYRFTFAHRSLEPFARPPII